MFARPLSSVSPAARRWWLGLAIVAGALLLLFGLWLARRPIADDIIRRELAARGVPAQYELAAIGFRTQRLENVRIGNPRAPDLVARWVEIDLVPTLGAPRVAEIRANGVRLRGRLAGGRLRLGAVEKLLPAPSGKPLALPDLDVRLTDTQLALVSPAGLVTLMLDGAGNLASGFSGQLRADAARLTAGDCTLTGVTGAFAVGTRAGRSRFDGPVAVDAVDCGRGRVARVSGRLDATLTPAFDGWRGFAQLASAAAEAQGWRARQLRLQLDFAGTAAATGGTARLAAFDMGGPSGTARRLDVAGRYDVGAHGADAMPEGRRGLPELPEPGWRFEGRTSVAGALPGGGLPRLAGGAGTPVAPLLAALDKVSAEASRSGLALASNLVAAQVGPAGSLSLEDIVVTGGGARASLTGGEGVRLVWPGAGEWQVDGGVALSGPGLPAVQGRLRQTAPGAPLEGVLTIAPWRAGGASLELAPIRIRDGSFTTRLLLSGPLANGRVDGLAAPLAGRMAAGGLILNPGCTPVTFRQLALAGLVLDPARLRVCADGAGLVAGPRVAGRLVAPRLSGRIGQSPVTLAARSMGFAGTRLTLDQLAVRLGGPDRLSRLDVARLTGDAAGDGFAGRYEGAEGEIGRVPLRLFDAAGGWRLAGGVLALEGAVRLADTANPPRFNALSAADFALRLAGSDVRASGTLVEPRSGARVTRVTLTHDLSAGRGGAVLDVPEIRFGPTLQPEAITRLTLGVVANVDGTLGGRGRIDWTPDGVTSRGDFRVRAAGLAAAFGPVTGLSGDVRFTDLLGLVTAPGQVMTVKSINPGVLVEDGVVRYQLIPGLRVEVLSGEWPFAGGRLSLRPTILDFSAEAARRLTFDVDGLDAARFITKLEVKNLDATGIFDGTLPMVFDVDGGRITGGALVSREPGGRLAYVGEVSNANLGIWGNIAFDALKSITYRNMAIDLNGDIDGEMVSRIRFEGVSRGTIQPVATGLIARVGGRLASQLQALPFRFNVQIRAPFRGLISTARSFYDPGVLVRDRLPPGFEPAPDTVQPPASRNKP